MSDLSPAENVARVRERNFRFRSGQPINFEAGWRAAHDYIEQGREGDRHALAIESQRADDAEDRIRVLEEALRGVVTDVRGVLATHYHGGEEDLIEEMVKVINELVRSGSVSDV